MGSDLTSPANIGSPEYVSVRELVQTVMEVSGKQLGVRYVPGPVGVQSRNFSNARIYSPGWQPTTSPRAGIGVTYRWIAPQVRSALASVVGSPRPAEPTAR